MTYPHGGAGQIWRDGDGGAHNPEKPQIRDWGAAVESDLTGHHTRILALEGQDPSAQNPKEPAACATVADITLSGEQAIDGVTTSADRVLVKDQANAAENGIYVSGSGAWVRAADMDADAEVDWATVYVLGGTANGGREFIAAVTGVTLETTDIVWVQTSDNAGVQGQIDDLDVRILGLEGKSTAVDFDLGSAVDTPLVHTAISNWSVRVTETRSVGQLQTSQPQASALMYGPLSFSPAPPTFVGKVFSATLTITDQGLANSGFGIGALPDGTAGGPFLTDSSMTGWILRENGAVQAYTDAGGSTVTSASARNGSPTITGVVWNAGDELKVEAEPQIGGGAVLRWFVAGALVATVNVDPAYWAENAIPAPLVYFTSSGGDVTFSAQSLVSVAGDAQALPYIQPGAPAGGNGTSSSPFETFADAIDSVDETADDLTLTLKGGTLALTTPITFDPARWRRVRIRAQHGSRPLLLASQAAGTWTQDGANPTVWWCDHFYGGVAATSTSGGVVRLDDDTVAGVPVRAFKRLAPNTAAATLAAETIPASSVDTATGRMYIVLPDASNPATHTLHLIQCDQVINAQTPASTDWRQSELILEGLRVQGGYSSGIQAALWRLSTEDVAVAGAILDGWSLDECTAFLRGGGAYGCGNDGVNMNPASGGPGLSDPVKLMGWDFCSVGHVQGDGLSNHAGGGDVILFGGRIADVGKDGLSMGQGGSLSGTLIENCVDTGLKLYDVGTVRGNGLQIVNCERGVQVTRNAGTGASMMCLTGGAIIGGDRALYVFSTLGDPTLATIDAYGVGTSGQVTAAVVNSGGTINRPLLALS